MPVVDDRLICCSCGNDLGDADDPYRDPDCEVCLKRQAMDEDQRDMDHEAAQDNGCSCPCHYDNREVAPHHTCCLNRDAADAQA